MTISTLKSALRIAPLLLLAASVPRVSLAQVLIQNCTSDSQCDDYVFCNGQEKCVPALSHVGSDCQRGTPPDCDDGISCTTDTCNEGFLRCDHKAPDADGDGHSAATCLDSTGKPFGDDCDDHDPNRFPGNLETCDSHDEDCDAKTLGQRDADGDGVDSNQCCNPVGGGMSCGADCDDVRSDVAPFLIDVCDGIDNDCSGKVDDGEICQPCGGLVTLYADADHDGFGDANAPMSGCANRAQFAPRAGDCDDTNPSIVPGAQVCATASTVKICTTSGAWTTAACLGFGERCLTQLDGTGTCLL
jgi:hypothetical protein